LQASVYDTKLLIRVNFFPMTYRLATVYPLRTTTTTNDGQTTYRAVDALQHSCTASKSTESLLHGSALTWTMWGGQWVYLTYFYHVGYLYAKNYQIWSRFEEVLTKQLGHLFGTPCTRARHVL